MRANGVIRVAAGLLGALLVSGAAAQHSLPLGDQRKERADQGELSGKGKDSREELRIERKTIPYETKYELSRTVGAGRLVKREDGVNGEIVRTYAVEYRDGRPAAKRLVKTERVEPKPALFLIGRHGFTASRGAYTRGKVLTMHTSAYDPSGGRGKRATGRTATGRPATYGMIAVDPRVIPIGTLLYVEGYGMGLAADTGGAIKGNKIDLCFRTRAQAMAWGRRNVKVHILRS